MEQQQVNKENKSVEELAKDMDKSIRCLALELPESVWLHVIKTWQDFKAGFLAASPKGKEEDELKELRAWKESAMRVMPDFQAIGKELGLKLGDTVHDKILPAIINYKKQLGITD